jgi:hypothetical protein
MKLAYERDGYQFIVFSQEDLGSVAYVPGSIRPEVQAEAEAMAKKIAALPDLIEQLQFAVARIELANSEGSPILSAWLPSAKAVLAAAGAA